MKTKEEKQLILECSEKLSKIRATVINIHFLRIGISVGFVLGLIAAASQKR